MCLATLRILDSRCPPFAGYRDELLVCSLEAPMGQTQTPEDRRPPVEFHGAVAVLFSAFEQISGVLGKNPIAPAKVVVRIKHVGR